MNHPYIKFNGDIVSIDREGEETDIPNYSLMQFTGLLDRKGREIYEGDVVRIRVGPLDNQHNYEVKLSVGSVGPCKAGNIMSWDLGDTKNLWDGKEVYVIGNIWENPELLK